MKKFKRTVYLRLARTFGRNDTGNPVPTIIGENTKVTGDIQSNGILHIDGTVEGDISCDELVIGVKGTVLGTVSVQSMHLYGSLQGKAVVDSLFIAKTARLVGDATHNTIAIEPGAYIDGHCVREKTQLIATEAITQEPARPRIGKSKS